LRFGQGDALIVVDMQADFCPGGALAVPRGNEIIAPINSLIAQAVEGGALIVASRDWHPPDHISFHGRGGPWPEHCVRESKGAEFCAGLRLPQSALLVSKGADPERDEHSALFAPATIALLREKGVRRIIVCGLALEICVRATALDAIRVGFETHLMLEATRALTPEAGAAAAREMAAAGVIVREEAELTVSEGTCPESQ
jgi:nicotinamidase/pyrazinamidase